MQVILTQVIETQVIGTQVIERRSTMLGKRREPRMPAKLHVRIAASDDSGRPILLMAPTRNISRQGAALEGIQGGLKVGQIVAITYKTSRARFRVTWAGDGERAGQIGVQSVETEKCIWDAATLPPMAADRYVAPTAQASIVSGDAVTGS